MRRFILRRIGLAALVALFVSMVSFSLVHLTGDPAASISGVSASGGDIEDLRRGLGLDRPIIVQYGEWLWRALRGDLGRSLFSNDPVVSEVAKRLPVTLKIGFGAFLLALLLGLLLGTLAALKPGSLLDRGILLFAVIGQSMPVFWLGLMLIQLLGVRWRLLPISGSDTVWHLVMPSLCLAILVMPSIVRLTRGGLVDAMRSDYVRTARAYGLPRWRVITRHALRNAILPVVSLSAVTLGFLLGGTVVIESVFALDGVGYFAFNAISRNDFPVVQAIVLMVSLLYLVLTTGADVLNAWLDPRLRTT
jgi:peptide/nickel transport system permease protein